MGFAAKVFFLLGLAAAVGAFPVQAEASPAAGGWPPVAPLKRAFNATFRCAWDQDATSIVCDPHTICPGGPIFMDWSAHHDRIVRLDMMVAVRYDNRDPRQERRNIACAKTVLDVFFPAWKDRRAWFDAAVAKALKNGAISARRVSRKKITVEYEHPNLPAEYVNVVIE